MNNFTEKYLGIKLVYCPLKLLLFLACIFRSKVNQAKESKYFEDSWYTLQRLVLGLLFTSHLP